MSALFGGSMDDFEGSLAAAIEDALHDVRREQGLDPPVADDDRRMLFIAIGRGVLAHLQQHEQAFRIHVGTTLPQDVHPDIDVR